MNVDIVLATYNGAAFLPQQLDSIIAQDHPSWRLTLRDDLSKDNTVEVIESYAARDSRISLLPNGGRNFGVIGNFSALLETTTAPYAMLCDQDDLWYPAKISKTLARMQALEARYGSSVPLLVHADARLIDADGGEIAPSFDRAQKLAAANINFPRLLVQNVALGCTVMVNRALLALALPIPPEARMHDHWFSLCAMAMGAMDFIDEPLMGYRQHGNNVVGVRRNLDKGYIQKATSIMVASHKQARALRMRINNIPDDRRRVIENFLKLDSLPPLKRGMAMLSGGYLRTPLWHNLPALVA